MLLMPSCVFLISHIALLLSRHYTWVFLYVSMSLYEHIEYSLIIVSLSFSANSDIYVSSWLILNYWFFLLVEVIFSYFVLLMIFDLMSGTVTFTLLSAVYFFWIIKILGHCSGMQWNDLETVWFFSGLTFKIC